MWFSTARRSSPLALVVIGILALILAACGGGTQTAENPTEAPVVTEAEPTEAAPTAEEAAVPTAEEAAAPTAEEEAAGTAEANLAAVKDYALENARLMKQATSEYARIAEDYFTMIEEADFDYQTAWDSRQAELADLLTDAKARWLDANLYYELDEGIVAGVPSLAYYDTWIDAGPTGEEDPAEALEWELELPDGRVLENPGNFFHNITEPALYGTKEEFTGLAVDLNDNGEVELGEALPEANVLVAGARGLDEATAELNQAIEDWEPTLEDAFTAMVVMVPTMNEYFEQWKLSAYVAGTAAQQENFVAVSRLFDIQGILNGLDVTYDNVSPLVAEADADLDAQIDSGFADLIGYVTSLYNQEQAGANFSAEEADLFGTEAQDRATALAGQISQAAALLNIEIAEG